MKRITILLALVSFLAGCSGKQNEKENTLIVTLNGPSGIGMVWLLEEADSLAAISTSVALVDEPSMVRSMILRNQPDLAVLPLNMASILYNRGAGYQLLAVPVWGTLYLFGNEPDISDWEDLRAKRVHLMARGMNPDLIFRFLLQQKNLVADEDVLLDYSFPTHIDLTNAAISGRVKLAVLSEPLISLAEQKNPDLKVLIDLNQAWMDLFPGDAGLPQTALVVKKEFALREPEKLQQLIERIAASFGRVSQDIEASAGAVVRQGLLPDLETAIRSIPRCRLNFRMASDEAETIYHYLGILHSFNADAVGGKMPDEQFIFKK